jgi:hypothetical protein
MLADFLEVRVTNLWVNRMIGYEQLPEDSERSPRITSSNRGQNGFGRETEPSRLAHVCDLSCLEKGCPIAGVRSAGTREAVYTTQRENGVGSLGRAAVIRTATSPPHGVGMAANPQAR